MYAALHTQSAKTMLNEYPLSNSNNTLSVNDFVEFILIPFKFYIV